MKERNGKEVEVRLSGWDTLLTSANDYIREYLGQDHSSLDLGLDAKYNSPPTEQYVAKVLYFNNKQ